MTTRPPVPALVLVVVEDEPDLRVLVRASFARDSHFAVEGEASTAAEAITLARDLQPDLIVLDNQLGEEMTGLQAAPLLKAAAPGVVIILFSASEELRVASKDSPSIDAFLLKTDVGRLVALARELLNL